jgi:hypothetical protein
MGGEVSNHRKRKKAQAYEAVKALTTQFPEAFRPTGPRKPLMIWQCC